MKFFIDTADVNEIRQAVELGLVDGVTTNPSLVAKSGRDFRDVLNEIITLVDGPISAEVIATDAPGMVREGQELAKINPRNIVIKVPMTEEGLKATRIFSSEGIKTNVTLVFSPCRRCWPLKPAHPMSRPLSGDSMMSVMTGRKGLTISAPFSTTTVSPRKSSLLRYARRCMCCARR
jgi:transaldolase